MSAQRQKPIDFAAEGLRLALFVDRNCGIQDERKSSTDSGAMKALMTMSPHMATE